MTVEAGFPNPAQAEIIRQREGALLVLAPAGTGKTRVMAERLAMALEDGLAPARTLAVTFTNRAAAEMRARVAERLGKAAREVNIRTFHGLCAWILRREAPDLGLAQDFVIYDEEDSKEVLKFCLRKTTLKVQDVYWELSRLKSACPVHQLTLAEVPDLDLGGQDPALAAALRQYHHLLAQRHALDFADLVLRVRAMLELFPEKQDHWSRRFDWVQVDEVQDTHHSEYEVVRHLCRRTGHLALFGDVDQTIYEWRGSEPDAVLDRFRQDFSPVTELSLVHNYRATRALLRVADRFASTFNNRRTRIQPAADLPEGAPPVLHCAPDPSGEAAWIAQQVHRLQRDDAWVRVGILARTHKRSQAVSRSLERAGIPHVTVEEYEFFRRQEIKDTVARLRLLLNPHDIGALGRIVRRPSSGIGNATLKKLWREGEQHALRVTDMLRIESHEHGDPFAPLLDGLTREGVVVLDVETTGLNPAEDEVIDIGAVRVKGGEVVDRFERLIRPSLPVGESAAVHGLTDEMLSRDGEPAERVFQALQAFVNEAHVVGHNVRFDLGMLRAHGLRAGVPLSFSSWDDTLEISRRLLRRERYDLDSLCQSLGTTRRPSHRALADTEATAELLLALQDPLATGSGHRLDLVARHGKHFSPLARLLKRWREEAATLRPGALCELMLEESGLRAYYARDARRTGHLDELVRFLQENDLAQVDPRTALSDLVQQVALARNVDHLAKDDPRVPVITIHQSKGLEFDAVFVAGATDGEFPSFYAVRDGKVEEERRLFYVAITRARHQLFVSSFRQNDQGRPTGPSPFVRSLSR